jgi:hypothetical protein
MKATILKSRPAASVVCAWCSLLNKDGASAATAGAACAAWQLQQLLQLQLTRQLHT